MLSGTNNVSSALGCMSIAARMQHKPDFVAAGAGPSRQAFRNWILVIKDKEASFGLQHLHPKHATADATGFPVCARVFHIWRECCPSQWKFK